MVHWMKTQTSVIFTSRPWVIFLSSHGGRHEQPRRLRPELPRARPSGSQVFLPGLGAICLYSSSTFPIQRERLSMEVYSSSSEPFWRKASYPLGHKWIVSLSKWAKSPDKSDWCPHNLESRKGPKPGGKTIKDFWLFWAKGQLIK